MIVPQLIVFLIVLENILTFRLRINYFNNLLNSYRLEIVASIDSFILLLIIFLRPVRETLFTIYINVLTMIIKVISWRKVTKIDSFLEKASILTRFGRK